MECEKVRLRRPTWSARQPLQPGLESTLQLIDTLLVAFVERPLLDTFAANETSLGEDAQMFARRWRADAEFFRNEESAHTILDKVAVFLRREMCPGILEPGKDLETTVVGDRFRDLS